MTRKARLETPRTKTIRGKQEIYTNTNDISKNRKTQKKRYCDVAHAKDTYRPSK